MGDVHKRKKKLCAVERGIWPDIVIICRWFCPQLCITETHMFEHWSTNVKELYFISRLINFTLRLPTFSIDGDSMLKSNKSQLNFSKKRSFKWQSCTSVDSNAMITSQTTVLVILVSFCYKKGAVGTKWNLSAYEWFSSHIWSDACSPYQIWTGCF